MSLKSGGSFLLLLIGFAFAIDTDQSQFGKRDLVVADDLPGNWTYYGCYLDGGTRTLESASYDNATGMTQESCISYCDEGGYVFAGVEYSDECYCGSTLLTNTSEPETDCYMACAGNATQACGGPDRLTLFWSGAEPAAGPTTNPGVNGWTLLGCYAEGTSGRALTTGMAVTGGSTAMSVEACTSACEAGGYSLAGVEYADECYCGNSISNGGKLAADGLSDCNMLCAGNSSEYCGAGNYLDVYNSSSVVISTTSSASASATSSTSKASGTSRVVSIPSGWTYAGCWIDNAYGRAITDGLAGDSSMTVESCISNCVDLNYTVAGMEYADECYCGNYLANGAAQTDDSDCDMACAGDSSEDCGAGNRLSVYNTGTLVTYDVPAAQTTDLPGSWNYSGCISDSEDSRTLFWQIILTNNNSATNCLGLCSQYGYNAGGMEYGDECYCGDIADVEAGISTSEPETDCATACSGDPEYLCGDGNRLSYYTWTGDPLYTWHEPTGANAGEYQFLIGGVVVPLISTVGINGKVTFLEKSGTEYPVQNSTGAYELDLAEINNFTAAWRPMSVKTDIFCSAGLVLPDKVGRQINVGGWSGTSTFGIRLYWPDGSPGVWGTNNWQENVDELSLLAGRWYPTAMMMTNGSILVVGGEDGSNGAPVPSLEILPLPAGGYAKYLDWLNRTDPYNLYPYLAVLPSGGIFAAYYNEARILDEVTLDTIQTLPNIPGTVTSFLAGRTYPLEGTAVLMPQYAPYTDPLSIMICGGSTPYSGLAIDNCVTIQPEVDDPEWVLERMPSQRVISCMTALPDGTYLILNGATQGTAGFGLAVGPNLNAVLYDPTQPVNSRMSIMDTTIVARMYHSEAVLLPDGRVLVSGSDPEDGVNPQEYRVEVFLPPYLLNGATQPSYSIADDQSDWEYGGSYTITIDDLPSGDTSSIRISLMAFVSSTHGNSMGQRTIFPEFDCDGSTCTITAPPNAHVSPPGWHMLYLLDGATPSVAQFVRIGGDPAELGNWPDFSDFDVPGV